MRRRLRYTAPALRSLQEIADYLAAASGDRAVAKRFVDLLRGKCRTLASLPGTLGRPRNELQSGLRSFAVKGYVIFFRYLDGVFEVIDVMDGRRDIDSHFADE